MRTLNESLRLKKILMTDLDEVKQTRNSVFFRFILIVVNGTGQNKSTDGDEGGRGPAIRKNWA